MDCAGVNGGVDKNLQLPGSGLVFNQQQLLHLTEHFCDQENSLNGDLKLLKSSNNIEVAVERLIQRLLCGVGILDRRFSSKFLVNLEPKKLFSKSSLSFSYLVRLDCLSSPALYPETETTCCTVLEGDGVPQGFARIRVQGENIERWAEFLNNNGFLRRDKVQERFVELLAQAAARTTLPGPPDRIDEATLCASPGKVVDAAHLHALLRIPADQQTYYGPGSNNRSRFPDPRDFRIAIVEGTQCVRLRVGFLSPSLAAHDDAEVTLVLGVGFSGWPDSSDFLSRTLVVHIDALLFHQAASTGFYLVPAAPHPTIRCEDKSSVWQYRFPAAEVTLLSHYSAGSVINKILSILISVLVDIRNKQNGGNVMSKYMIKTIFFFHLETNGAHYKTVDGGSKKNLKDGGPNEMLMDLKQWTYNKISRRVLIILDELVVALKAQRYRSYFFKYFNIMLNSPGGGTLHYTEEDYCHDAELLTVYIHQLHQMSSLNVTFASSNFHLPNENWWKIELQLISKWQNVLLDLLPRKKLIVCNKRRRFLNLSREFDYDENSYEIRQLEYISQVLRALLHVKSLVVYQSHHTSIWLQSSSGPTADKSKTVGGTDPKVEDVTYLISILLDQAWRMSEILNSNENYSSWTRAKSRTAHDKRKTNFQTAVKEFLDETRHDLRGASISSDPDLVRFILGRLYAAASADDRHLSVVLRPFLRRLFLTSHENCWYLDEYNWRKNEDEISSLGQFCHLIAHESEIPLEGLLDAVKKGWDWADGILRVGMELESETELILTPNQRTTVRVSIAILPEDFRFKNRSLGKSGSLRSTSISTLPSRSKTMRDTLKGHLYREIADQNSTSVPDHCKLRDLSPLTQVLEKTRRYGSHRGLGSIVNALITLNKFMILQEVSLLLPEDQRLQILDDIHKISKERRRNKKVCCNEKAKKGSGSLPRRLLSGRKEIDLESATYRSINELSLFNESIRQSLKISKSKTKDSTNQNGESSAERLTRLGLNLDEPPFKNSHPDKASLLGTCRLARSRIVDNSFLYNPSAFYDAPPSFYENITNNLADYSSRTGIHCNPLSQPYLQLAPDNTLCLTSTFSNEPQMESLGASARFIHSKDEPVKSASEKELITKL